MKCRLCEEEAMEGITLCRKHRDAAREADRKYRYKVSQDRKVKRIITLADELDDPHWAEMMEELLQ